MAKRDIFKELLSAADLAELRKQLSEVKISELDEKQLEQIRKELSELDFSEDDKKRLAELQTELEKMEFPKEDFERLQFELSLFESDLDFLLF